MEILANFIVTFINNTIGKLIFFKVCREGESIIRTCLGKPRGWYTQPTIYFNIPFFQELTKVDMRRKFETLYAHSFQVHDMGRSLMPYNIIMDFQVEYQIRHPYIIFKIEDAPVTNIGSKVKYESTKVGAMVENLIHSELSNFLDKEKYDISYSSLIRFTESICEKYNNTEEIIANSEFDADLSFSINSLVITSFDKNISLRTTV